MLLQNVIVFLKNIQEVIKAKWRITINAFVSKENKEH